MHLRDLDVVKNKIISVPDLMSLNLTINHFNLTSMSLNNEDKIVTLGDNNLVRFDLRDFEINFNSSYSFITDPPMVADMGNFFFESNGTNSSINGTLFLNDEDQMETRFYEFKFSSLPVWTALDGVSELSHVIGRLLKYVSNVLVNRFNSISNYTAATGNINKIEYLINSLLAQIPDEGLSVNSLLIEGGLQSNPVVVKDQYMKLEFDVDIQDQDHRNTRPNIANFNDTIEQK